MSAILSHYTPTCHFFVPRWCSWPPTPTFYRAPSLPCLPRLPHTWPATTLPPLPTTTTPACAKPRPPPTAFTLSPWVGRWDDTCEPCRHGNAAPVNGADRMLFRTFSIHDRDVFGGLCTTQNEQRCFSRSDAERRLSRAFLRVAGRNRIDILGVSSILTRQNSRRTPAAGNTIRLVSQQPLTAPPCACSHFACAVSPFRAPADVARRKIALRDGAPEQPLSFQLSVTRQTWRSVVYRRSGATGVELPHYKLFAAHTLRRSQPLILALVSSPLPAFLITRTPKNTGEQLDADDGRASTKPSGRRTGRSSGDQTTCPGKRATRGRGADQVTSASPV